jgi:hypothetical protein
MHVGLQTGWISKHLLANIALVPSLSLHSFLSVVSSSSWGHGWRVQVFVFVVDDAFLDFLDDAFGLSRFSFRRRRRREFSVWIFRWTRLSGKALGFTTSFVLNKSRFFFLYLMMIRLEIIILVRNPRTQHRWLLFFHLQNRPRVHRSFRMWIFPSAAHSSSFVVMPREILFIQNINAFRFFSRMWFEMSLDQNTKNSHKMPTLKPSKEIWIRTRLTNKRERSRDLFHVYHWMRVSLLFIPSVYI